MRVEERTLGYLVKEKLQQNKLKGKTKRRAWIFEERLEKKREWYRKEMSKRNEKK